MATLFLAPRSFRPLIGGLGWAFLALPSFAGAEEPPPVPVPPLPAPEVTQPPPPAPTGDFAAQVVDLSDPVWPRGQPPEQFSLRLMIGADGSVQSIVPVGDVDPLLLSLASDAVRKGTFFPATRGGQPVAAELVVDFVVPPGETPPAESDVDETFVVRDQAQPEPERGAGDFRIDVHDQLAVPSLNAADALTLAPGLFLVRSGSDAHPEQIFLRGFDARHGQDIAFSVDGLPLNQVGNPHGHGLVDLHAIIPETIETLRVVEGPFDPSQGDFAVAGSARLTLGLPDPGLVVRGQVGSYGTRRAMMGWRHRTELGTFLAGEVFQTEGWGENRGAIRGTMVARMEKEAEVGTVHALTGLYASTYDHAGVVRAEDVAAGRMGLFDTRDPNQGGDASQGFVALGMHGSEADLRWSIDGGLARRGFGLRDNFTGFLLDDRRPGESEHGQRGDLVGFRSESQTLSLDGRAELLLGEGDLRGVVRAGMYGRSDHVLATAQRLRAIDARAYRTEADYELDQTNLALWGEGELGLWERLQVRAGLRAESFQYGLLDHCAAKDAWFPGIEQDDVNCPDEDRYGIISRTQGRSAQGMGLAPKASLSFEMFPNHLISAAGGRGLRSLEALALSQGEDAPFGSLWSAEGGYTWRQAGEHLQGAQRLVGFWTLVERDLVFDEEQAANVVAGETRRIGALLDSELHLGGFVARNSLTWTHAVFGEDLPPSYTFYHTDRQPGMLIPYVPPWVATSNLSYSWDHGPWSIDHGLGTNFVSARPLPQSEWSEAFVVFDAQTELRRGIWGLGISVDNLLNHTYSLAEYNYASHFPTFSGDDFPSRVPTRHLSPGAPRTFLFTFSLWPDRL